MNIMQTAEGFLYVVSAALYYPVILGLVALVFFIVIQLGSLARDFLDRQRGDRPAREAFRTALGELLDQSVPDHRELEMETLLQETERRLGKPIERARFIVRAGPGIGLMGTLIPMGVSLAALAQGDMPDMAQHMVHAFNSAVVGLGSGVVAFAIALVREQWLRQDVIEIRRLAEQAIIDGRVPAPDGTGGRARRAAAGEPG